MASTRAEGADPRAAQVLGFWFGDDWATAGKLRVRQEQMQKWFGGGTAVDQEIRAQFGGLLETLRTSELDAWLQHPANALAGVIAMDQFSRNAFRSQPEMYALDAKALAWAKHIKDTKLCHAFPYVEQLFLGLPFIHSEKLEDQQTALAMIEEMRDQVVNDVSTLPHGSPDEPGAQLLLNLVKTAVDMAERHAAVVAQWGRFPHRNEILGRQSTPEEVEGLAKGTIERF